MRFTCLLCMLTVLFGSEELLGDTIIRRDGLQPIRGAILSGGVNGLRIELLDGGRETRLIPWSVVLEIQSARPHPTLEIFIEQGRQLFRAKQRLLRGDVLLAEPLFSESFSRLVGTDSDDARLASEGLLRCAIARGDFSIAVHPWLETIRLIEMNTSVPFTNLEPILDSSTMLCPHLPPVWLNDPQLVKVCKSYREKPQQITASIAVLLTSKQPQALPIDGIEDPFFLWQILHCADGKQDARDALLNRQKQLIPWKRVWSDYFIAEGYLADSSDNFRTMGLIHLAKVASIHPRLQPWLTCASMLRLSDAMQEEGEEEASLRIKDEALRLFPVHPLHAQDSYQIRSSVQ